MNLVHLPRGYKMYLPGKDGDLFKVYQMIPAPFLEHENFKIIVTVYPKWIVMIYVVDPLYFEMKRVEFLERV